MRLALPGLLLARFTAVAGGQDLTLLDSMHVRLISQEISGDAAYDHVRFMSQFHRPRGSDNLWKVAEYHEEKARELGLEDVKLIKQAASAAERPWNARFADLWIVDPAQRVASTLQSRIHLADRSRAANVTAELIDIEGGSTADYAGKEVSGKIVLTYGPLAQVMRDAVQTRGAHGIIWYPNPHSSSSRSDAALSRPDQVRWLTVRNEPLNGREPTFAFVLSMRQGVELRNRISASKSPIRVRALVDAAFSGQQGTEPWQVMVEAFIRGTDPALGQDIVLTAHLQEEAHSSNDDASGTANLLEIGRALKKLIDDGHIPRPRRNLRFWWTTENSSERQYFTDHPAEAKRMWVNINQDMVGADQSQDVMRKQNVTRLPAMRFHFFNDVMEAVLEYMVAANTMDSPGGIPFYPKPHLSNFGSMHRYNAEAVFFRLGTDHQTFNEAPIGIPGVTFTNVPDRYIHSSDDDLWNIDRTQLGRNALSVALIAYVMASADEAAIPALAAETVGRGEERLGRNLRLALSWIARDGDQVTSYYNAVDQLDYAVQRERRAVESLLSAHSAARSRVTAQLQELEGRRTQALRQLNLAYRLSAGRAPPTRMLTTVERQLAALRPSLNGGPREFQAKRLESQQSGTNFALLGTLPAGLSVLMAFEVLNAIDGSRTALEIYRQVAAELREGGSHYYGGSVRAEDVLTYLAELNRLGLIKND